MKFIKDLTNKEVILAPTKEISDKLRFKFDELGLKWTTGMKYTCLCYWGSLTESLAYLPALGQVGSEEFYKENGYTFYNIDDLLDFEGRIK